MTFIASLPIFIWDHIVNYLSNHDMAMLLQTGHMFEAAIPDLYYENNFLSSCDNACIVRYKSETDPFDETPTKLKEFWKHALINKVECENDIGDIFRCISYHNKMRKNRSAHIHYKVFSRNLFNKNYRNQYKFAHGRCSIEIFSLGYIIKIEPCPFINNGIISLSGIESLTLNNIVFCDLVIKIIDSTTLIVDECAFIDYFLKITSVSNITVNRCTFRGLFTHLKIIYADKPNNYSNIVNIRNNRFDGRDKSDFNKQIIIADKCKACPMITIKNNVFSEQPMLANGLSNCNITTKNNGVRCDGAYINDMITQSALYNNKLIVYDGIFDNKDKESSEEGYLSGFDESN